MRTFFYYKKISPFLQRINEEDMLTAFLLMILLFSFIFLFSGISAHAGNGSTSVFTPWLQNCLSFQSLFTS